MDFNMVNVSNNEVTVYTSHPCEPKRFTLNKLFLCLPLYVVSDRGDLSTTVMSAHKPRPLALHTFISFVNDL